MAATQIVAFVRASVSVFRDMLGLEVKSGETEVEGDSFVSQGFTVIIGFTGGWKGRFIMDMTGDMAMYIASALTGEDYQTYAEEEVLLSGAELGNIISGNAITDINNNNRGLNLRITPPSVFTGKDLSMFNVRLNSSSVLMQTDAGSLKINVAVEEGKG